MGMVIWSRIKILSTFFLLFIFSMAQAQVSEYQVKAAMLYNFALFIEWPKKTFSSAEDPFVFCVLGKDPFGTWLKHEVGVAKIDTHPTQIRYLKDNEAPQNCHILFISRSEEENIHSIAEKTRNSSTLIVSDAANVDAFCRQGGMIGLTMEGQKVRFEVNANATTSAELKFDSKLERIAKSTKCGEAK